MIGSLVIATPLRGHADAVGPKGGPTVHRARSLRNSPPQPRGFRLQPEEQRQIFRL